MPKSPSLRMVRWDRPELTRSSYPFGWLAPHPRARRLVQQYRLDEVVAPGKSDFERLCILRDWCCRQWSGWQRSTFPFCCSWDPIEILDTVKNNWGYGMCTHWAALFAGAAAALGYPARILVIDHHCLNEVWVDDLGKWIIMDCAGDNNFVWELDGQILNALELHAAVRRGRSDDLRVRAWLPFWRARPANAIGEPKEVCGRNLEYVCRPGRRAVEIYCRIGIALRNDHLVQPAPVEDKHGHDHYHWNGYLWWTDAASPTHPEYSLQTQRAGDLYWTVGRVRVHLREADTSDRLDVRLEHTMPNFLRFEAKRGEEWSPVEDNFEWSLDRGMNALDVRAVSAFQRAGPTTTVQIERR